MLKALLCRSMPRRRSMSRHSRAMLVAALVGLGFFAAAGAAEAHPRHKGHGRAARHHASCAPYVGVPYGGIYVRPAPVVYYPAPVYAHRPIHYGHGYGYRRVWQPGHYQWHAARRCNVWVPGVYIQVRI
jgi:hypothetical protein